MAGRRSAEPFIAYRGHIVSFNSLPSSERRAVLIYAAARVGYRVAYL